LTPVLSVLYRLPAPILLALGACPRRPARGRLRSRLKYEETSLFSLGRIAGHRLAVKVGLWHPSSPAAKTGAGRGGKMESGPRRRRVEPTDQWEQIELLCGWPEQRDYELIRPLVLFGDPADGRSRETGASSGRTLRRRAARFEAEGMESLFDSEAARRRRLPPGVRRLVVDLKAEYPAFNPNEISRICYVRFGRRPACKTVKRVLTEEPVPLRFVRRFPPYHEIPRRREARAAVALHADGWSAKAISGYLRVGTSTVYRILRRWAEEGPEGLEDRRHGRPPGVRKVTLKAIEAIRRLQQNPHLGEFRIHAALAIPLRGATQERDPGKVQLLPLHRRGRGMARLRG
jgi:hypothetical protein